MGEPFVAVAPGRGKGVFTEGVDGVTIAMEMPFWIRLEEWERQKRIRSAILLGGKWFPQDVAVHARLKGIGPIVWLDMRLLQDATRRGAHLMHTPLWYRLNHCAAQDVDDTIRYMKLQPHPTDGSPTWFAPALGGRAGARGRELCFTYTDPDPTW